MTRCPKTLPRPKYTPPTDPTWRWCDGLIGQMDPSERSGRAAGKNIRYTLAKYLRELELDE